VTVAFDQACLRANPGYRALPWNRLPSELREAGALENDGYGLLLAREGSDLPPTAIDRDTALLFLALQEPGPAPDFVFAAGTREAERILRRLLLDRVLELAHGEDFVSGAQALAHLGLESTEGRSRLAQLSLEAIRYGAALGDLDAATLARKLYAYNTRPTTPELRRRLPDRAACIGYLGLGPGSPARRAIESRWSLGETAEGWLVFSRVRPVERPADQPCKLYLGLAFEELPACLVALAEALGRSAALQFKIGADRAGLLRPDKCVAYFPGREAVLEASQHLLAVAEGRRVQAVPFSAEIGAAGALSWGVDPATQWFGERESWRQWICEKLAAALVLARGGESHGIEPWRFALERLALEGVDAETFMPTSGWSEAA